VPQQPAAVPKAVRTLFRLLILGGVLAVGDLIASLLALAHFHAKLPAYLAVVGPLTKFGSIDGEVASNFAYAIFVAALSILLLPMCLVVRLPGRPGVRIVALWVIGVVLMTIAVGFAAVPDVSGLIDPTGLEAVPEALISAQHSLLPVWYTSLHQIALFAVSAVVIATMVLLLRESAADYFRKQHVGEDRGLWTFVDKANG
jgi:hypothetical protein